MVKKSLVILLVAIVVGPLLLAANAPKPTEKPAEKPGPKSQAVEQIVSLMGFKKTPKTQELLDNFAALSQGQVPADADNELKAEYVLVNMRTFVFSNFANGAAAPDTAAVQRKREAAAAKFGIEVRTPEGN